jgi:hypothetical protein
VAVALSVAAVAGFAVSGAGGSVPRSGLYGVVTRGPITPVCREGVPCNGPAVGVTLRFLRAGREVARTRTGPQGRYRIALERGTYAVRTLQKMFGRVPAPARVVVERGRFRRIDFFIDTGIR